MQNKLAPFAKQIRFVGFVFALLAIIELINLATGRVLNQFSIVPRDLDSLIFILTAPFLHADIQHFFSNIITLCVFALLTMQFGQKKFFIVSVLLIVSTGVLVWLFARTAYHLGASGVIYGYFGYLVLAGFLSKKISLTMISLFVAVFYGAMVWGVLPSRPYISWEAHLFGFVSGVGLAYVFRAKS